MPESPASPSGNTGPDVSNVTFRKSPSIVASFTSSKFKCAGKVELCDPRIVASVFSAPVDTIG